MKITKITVQKKNSYRYSIFVDNVYSFSLSDSALLDSKLKIGLEVDAEKLTELKDQSQTDKLYQKVLNLLSLRPRSEYEIVTYLKKHDCPTTSKDLILNKLRERRYINDSAFARSWIDNRRLLRPTSKMKLKNELRQKGLNNKDISMVFEELEFDDSSALRQMIDKKRKLTRYKDDLKLMQYLVRQGFSYEDVKREINN